VRQGTYTFYKLSSRVLNHRFLSIVLSSFVGVCVSTKATVNIPDAYNDCRFDPTVDEKTGYRTKSLLCEPIISNGEVRKFLVGLCSGQRKGNGH
jgi:hypothetical protein